MSAPLSPERLAEIAARAGGATPGPWRADSHEIYQGDDEYDHEAAWIGETCRAEDFDGSRADAAFIAAARTDVPVLLARVAELEAEADRLASDRDRWRARYYEESRTYWDAELPPGGECCADCYQPVESEPCPEHHPATVAARLQGQLGAVLDLCDRAERGATRWESPLPVPEWVAEVRAAALRGALAGPAGDTSRAEVLREAQDATVAWLLKKAGEEIAVARQEEERRATARARHRRERADLISTLASKADRGAIREFLAATPPQPTPAEVLADAADRIAARAAQLGGEWLRVDQVCDALRRLGTDPAPSTHTAEAGDDRG